MKLKKLIAPALVLSSALFIPSCDKANVDVDFNLDVANIYFTVDTTSLTGNVDLAVTQFSSGLAAELDAHDAGLGDVESIEVTGVEFIHQNPTSQYFNVIERAYAFLSVPGLAEQRIAYKDPVPNGIAVLPMDNDIVNLKDYLTQPTVTLRVAGELSGPNTEADSLQAIITFRIHASVAP
jgi:hypothetical protein